MKKLLLVLSIVCFAAGCAASEENTGDEKTSSLAAALQGGPISVGGGVITNAGSDGNNMYLTLYTGSGIPGSQARNVVHPPCDEDGRCSSGPTRLELNVNGFWLPVTITYASRNFSSGVPAVIQWGPNNVGFATNAQFNLRVDIPIGGGAPAAHEEEDVLEPTPSGDNGGTKGNDGCGWNQYGRYVCS